MRSRTEIVLLLILVQSISSAWAEGIEEIRVADIDEAITLRANGTAVRTYRGRWAWKRRDEQVGHFQAEFDRAEFQRLAALPGAVKFDQLKSPTIPYPTVLHWTTAVRDGVPATRERHERGAIADPSPPSDLWTLEMAVRGVAARINWEPVSSGLRVSLIGAGAGLREVMVREAGTNFPVGTVRTVRDEVEIPVLPGNYLVEACQVQENRCDDLWKRGVTVKAGQYERATVDSPPEILIVSPNGWWLQIRSDGSGILGHGPSDNNAATFAAETIEFASTLQELLRMTVVEPPKGPRFRVVVPRQHGVTGTRYPHDSELVLSLFNQAAAASSSSDRGSGFDRQWNDNPPCLSDR